MENMYFNKNKVKIVDNFLSEKDFNELLSLKIEKILQKKFNIYHNEIDDEGVISSTIDKKLIERLHKTYHAKAISILSEINKDKVELRLFRFYYYNNR